MVAFDTADGGEWAALVSAIREKLTETPGQPSQSGPPLAPLSPAVSGQELAQEEARLGFALPPLLRLLYTRVGNGGFGPGGGLLSLRQISPKIDQSVATLYHQLHTSRATRGEQWQEGIVPFAQWGDFIFSCIDLASERRDDPSVIRFEPNMPAAATHAYLNGGPFRGAGLIPERDRLSNWFEDWIADHEMFGRPYSVRNKG
jgi:hypothetical protein